MVAPVNNNGNVTSLQRPLQAKNITPKTFTDGLVPAKSTPSNKPSSDVTITLASANSRPNPNLPRGSIVDRLV